MIFIHLLLLWFMCLFSTHFLLFYNSSFTLLMQQLHQCHCYAAFGFIHSNTFILIHTTLHTTVIRGVFNFIFISLICIRTQYFRRTPLTEALTMSWDITEWVNKLKSFFCDQPGFSFHGISSVQDPTSSCHDASIYELVCRDWRMRPK